MGWAENQRIAKNKANALFNAKTGNISIGTSGFGYTLTKEGDYATASIKNINTGIAIFSIRGGSHWSGRGTRAKKYKTTDAKKFLGLDNKYYYITVLSSATIDWGQIQPDGSVLRENRTILTMLPFYPVYKDSTPTVPVTKIEKAPVIIPTTPVTTLTTTLPSAAPQIGDNEWLKKIKNMINQIIQLVLNLLKLNK